MAELRVVELSFFSEILSVLHTLRRGTCRPVAVLGHEAPKLLLLTTFAFSGVIFAPVRKPLHLRVYLGCPVGSLFVKNFALVCWYYLFSFIFERERKARRLILQ